MAQGLQPLGSGIDSGSLGSLLQEFQMMAPLEPYQQGAGQQAVAPYAFNRQTTTDLLGAFSQQSQQDKKRFMSTFQNLFKQIPELQNQLLGDINQMGASRTGQINEQFSTTTNNALARLSDRGIGGSTYAVNAAQGAERQRQFALNDLQDRLLGQKIDVRQQYGNALFGAEQQYANKQFAEPSTLIALLQSIGRGGGGLDRPGASQGLTKSIQGLF